VPPPEQRCSKLDSILTGAFALGFKHFFRFAERARQSECETNLKSFFTSERTRRDGVLLELSKVGFVPERGNRYAYFVAPGPMEDRSGPVPKGVEEARAIGVDTYRHPGAAVKFEQLPPYVAELVGISGQCPACNITMVCAGNLDSDRTLDIWSISTADRTLDDGTLVSSGEPFHHVHDIK
jgi:type IV pilus assembly protein PilA